MSYFSQFQTEKFKIDNVEYEIEDLTRRVSNFPNQWYNTTYIEDFYIRPGLRPDQLANQLYSDVNLWWTFYILNGITDFEWPIDEDVLEDEILSKFSQFHKNHSTAKLRGKFESSFRTSDNNLVNHQSARSLFEGSPYGRKFLGKPLSTFREEMIEKNERKRNIKIVSVSFIFDFVKDFSEKIKNEV